MTGLRLTHRRSRNTSSGVSVHFPQRTFFSLGRAIVALYVITLLTAVISAKTVSDDGLAPPGTQVVEPCSTAPPTIDG